MAASILSGRHPTPSSEAPLHFGSDTTAPAHPAVLEALARANTGYESSYGNDALTGRLRALLTETLSDVMMISIDAKLCYNAQRLGLHAVNFNHIREESWES